MGLCRYSVIRHFYCWLNQFFLILIFQALPFAMQSLIEPELAEMKALLEAQPHLAEAFPDGIQDPCTKYCDILDEFVTWYFKARKSKHSESSIWDVAERGFRLQEKLLQYFPNRSGKCFILSENESDRFFDLCMLYRLSIRMEDSEIPRYPSYSSTSRHVRMLGKCQYRGKQMLLLYFTCTDASKNAFHQACEMAHKAHVKEAMFSTNRKDWETQIMSVHARQDALVHLRTRISGIRNDYRVLFCFIQSYNVFQRRSIKWTTFPKLGKHGNTPKYARRHKYHRSKIASVHLVV